MLGNPRSVNQQSEDPIDADSKGSLDVIDASMSREVLECYISYEELSLLCVREPAGLEHGVPRYRDRF
jgi:hypothetical protein